MIKDSFVTLSDFHAMQWPLEKIRQYYLNEYDKVYILGDATDRGIDHNGTGGIGLLLNIMNLSKRFSNRVIYIPGNHDQFLFEYICGDSMSGELLKRNGGKNTIRELEHLKNNYPNMFIELANWLATLPLQVMHKYNNQEYAFAHAFFNQRLYYYNPNLCLNDLVNAKNTNLYKVAENILWFRKTDSQNKYNPHDCPNPNVIEVIGHTPEKYRQGLNSLDLKNEKGQTIKVKCVDGGVSYGGSMLKFDGHDNIIRTVMLEHNDTSFKDNNSNQKRILTEEELNSIIGQFQSSKGGRKI